MCVFQGQLRKCEKEEHESFVDEVNTSVNSSAAPIKDDTEAAYPTIHQVFKYKRTLQTGGSAAWCILVDGSVTGSAGGAKHDTGAEQQTINVNRGQDTVEYTEQILQSKMQQKT